MARSMAWLVMAILERTGLSRHVWHLPLFFLARGELKTLVCLASDNIFENREFVANSQRFAERSGAEKMISATQGRLEREALRRRCQC